MNSAGGFVYRTWRRSKGEKDQGKKKCLDKKKVEALGVWVKFLSLHSTHFLFSYYILQLRFT